MTDHYPPHLKRHKEIYERHENGEYYTTIARELGISVNRVRMLAMRWERYLREQETEKNRVYIFRVPKPKK